MSLTLPNVYRQHDYARRSGEAYQTTDGGHPPQLLFAPPGKRRVHMPEKPANGNHPSDQAHCDGKLSKKVATDIHRPTVDRADARVARTLCQL
jgi:hypothetical protein